jgi:DNA mismatch endonuclease, patch repair protein
MDNLSPQERHDRMSRVRAKNTKPEMVVRRLLFKMGYRYRLHSAKLPGKPDIVFLGRKKVISVHGCFWHRHLDPACRLTRLPKPRLDFWEPKFERNMQRDLENEAKLMKMGWTQLRHPSLEHEITGAQAP